MKLTIDSEKLGECAEIEKIETFILSLGGDDLMCVYNLFVDAVNYRNAKWLRKEESA